MSSTETWQEKVNKKRSSLYQLIPQAWRLSDLILQSLPKDCTMVPVTCGILSELDLEITEIDDIDELSCRIANGIYSAVQVTEAYCKRAAIAHQLVNCLAEILFTQALDRARSLDEYFKSTGGKTIGPLHGIPISFKDQFNIKGVETAMGYIGYLGIILDHNSILVDCILSLGAVLYVKTALPQSIMLAETRSNLLGETRNPRNRELSCGGSSGGEGALSALKGSICGFGTDIGGSVRTPAAGQESVPSVVGPISRSLGNIRTILKAITESKTWLIDPKVHNIPWREEMFQFQEGQKNKLCFGVIRFDQHVHISPPVQRAIDTAISAVRIAGHEVVEWDTSDNLQCIEILSKMYLADGGKDVETALEISGEPKQPGIYIGSKETELSVYENWQVNLARNAYAIKYLEKWNKTREITTTGRPVDGIISPVNAMPAYPTRFMISIGYTGIANLLQLSSIVLPVIRVDTVLDQINDGYRNSQIASESDQAAKNAYKGSEAFENIIVGLQIMCRRLEEEKAIAMAMVLEQALQSYQSK
ncbi:unnamed protein product [Rotaria socialis]|uniref:Amidase domain-containing protein n=2 Tax=Rotaria socialis TaxID=392032 RepID=A0A820U592_9BILA|nr:unnamed protein product [Rotaria socialis]CAF4476633.1 unnamed protein product [Rotaria socialis]